MLLDICKNHHLFHVSKSIPYPVRSAMYLSIVKIDVRPGQEHTVMDVLESVKGPALSMAGCLGCSVSIEGNLEGSVCYLERWKDFESLALHLRSPLYTRVLAAMELSRTPPVVEFFEVINTGGLELVEEARTPL